MLFAEELKQTVRAAGAVGEIIFSAPPKPEMGDLAFNCFNAARLVGKNPMDLAQELTKKIIADLPPTIAAVKSFGPYVNFFFSTGILAKEVLTSVNQKDKRLMVGCGRRVLIEYPSQNTHKEFHIGHLRNVCIGNALVQLYLRHGYKIIPVNYINDFGAHVVKCLWGILNHTKLRVRDVKAVTNRQKWLGEVYAIASQYIKDHEVEIKPELDDLQARLERRESHIMRLFRRTRQWSLDGFARIHRELGVKHRVTFLESQVKDKGQKIVDELLQHKIARIGEGGAVIVDLSVYGLEVALVRKSTGAGVYLTSDLALAREKFKKFAVAESINITGVEQEFYFQQLFKILALSGFKNKTTHIGYGLVNLPEGKMSSRAGNVILYEDLRDQVYARLSQEMIVRHGHDWSRARRDKIVRILTQAVLKFTMQQHEAGKTLVFDVNQAVSFEGFSAPYILYAVARINSLTRRARRGKFGRMMFKLDYNLLQRPEEKKLLILLGNYDEIIQKALSHYNPSVVAKYCFDLAQAFNEFYNHCQVVGEAQKNLGIVRLRLCDAVRKTLIAGLDILTIKTVAEM